MNAVPTANELNQIDVKEVLVALNGVLASGSYSKQLSQTWIINSTKFGITCKEDKVLWIDNATKIGGAGNVKLVQHVLSVDYFHARDFLMSLPGKAGRSLSYTAVDVSSLAVSVEPLREIQAAIEFDDSKWPRVRDYLTVERCINLELVDYLYSHYKIGADSRSNAIFCRENRGYFTRGTGITQPNCKPYRPAFGNASCGCFIVKGEVMGAVAFVEAPIDAISLHQIYSSLTVVATGGSTVSIKAAIKLAEGVDDVYAAFDADEPGESYSSQLFKLRPDAQRLVPPEKKDWNEWLKIMPR